MRRPAASRRGFGVEPPVVAGGVPGVEPLPEPADGTYDEGVYSERVGRRDEEELPPKVEASVFRCVVILDVVPTDAAGVCLPRDGFYHLLLFTAMGTVFFHQYEDQLANS